MQFCTYKEKGFIGFTPYNVGIFVRERKDVASIEISLLLKSHNKSQNRPEHVIKHPHGFGVPFG